jgi:hypothetical protein
VQTPARMNRHRARILVMDHPQGTLALALEPALAGHDVDFARDAVDAIYHVDSARRPYDGVVCDLADGDLPGPELWAYLSISRRDAADRMVFVASGPLGPATQAFLARVPNSCIQLPVDPDVFVALARRRAAAHRSAWGAKLGKAPPDRQQGAATREGVRRA